MIDKSEIETKSDELGVHVANVQRDYVFGWLLSGLFQPDNPLRGHLILKGGNGFRKAYFEHARFSNDLDFSTKTELDGDLLRNSLKQACSFAMEKSGVEFLPDDNRIGTRQLAEEDSVLYEARVYFKSFYGEDEATLKVKLDIKEYDQIFLPPQTRQLIHAYSDADQCRAEIQCHKLEELLASKLKALLQRNHSADLYDFVYAVFFQKFLNISRLEVISTFLKKTIYEPNPQVAKGLLLDLPFQFIRGLWDEYLVCPKLSVFKFEDAENWFRIIVNELFMLLLPSTGFTQPAFGRSLSYFPPRQRDPIFEAGRLQRLLRVVYDRVERIVEPYALAFKRRKDGVGREYFYVWDRSGGHSRHIGIKSFLSDKLQSIQMTDQTFEPRFPIELTKGTGFFAKSSFSTIQNTLTPRKKSAQSYSTGTSYTVECPYCGKKFKRSQFNTMLNEHKDKFGNRCFGRFGTIV
jgi:predicted nucleotidyltransferase component of viral defense system